MSSWTNSYGSRKRKKFNSTAPLLRRKPSLKMEPTAPQRGSVVSYHDSNLRFPDLKKRREYLLLTQIELAELAGISYQSIYSLELGSRGRISTMRKLKEALQKLEGEKNVTEG